MEKPIIISGRRFRPEVIERLKQLEETSPELGSNEFAKVVGELVGWYAPTGRIALASVKLAVRKLRKRGILRESKAAKQMTKRRRMQSSGQPLPGLRGVPSRAGQVKGLRLYLLEGYRDEHHGAWNDLIIQQHPCGDAPLAGAQLRYLIGSDHGWLGAVGISAGAFVLGARDKWIGWGTASRLAHIKEVLNVARLLIRREVRCRNLASKVLSMVVARVSGDWQQRYGVQPLLLETFVERERYTGRCFAAANWRRIGHSSGRGRLGQREPSVSVKDIWVYELDQQARRKLQVLTAPPLAPIPLLESLAHGCGEELTSLELGDQRRVSRAQRILQARWEQPRASFFGSFATWAEAKGAYGLIESKKAGLSLSQLLAAHSEVTQARMAAEPVVLLAHDTTTLNYSGLTCTQGLGKLGEGAGRGLWLHTALAYRPDAVPLGILGAKCWARSEDSDTEQRNAQGIDQKESVRWVEVCHQAAATARRMPQTTVVTIADREGDIYEVYAAVKNGPDNLRTLVRAQHDRTLAQGRLWEHLQAQPAMDTRLFTVPRGHGHSARAAHLQIRWAEVTIEAPAVGCKKGWPSLSLRAVLVQEINPPAGVPPIEWMLLCDLPVQSAAQAWEIVGWYRIRWGIEEWHRVLKTGCNAEGREQKSLQTLQCVLALDMIVAWRVLAFLKLGRSLPQLPASLIYTELELTILSSLQKKLPLSPLPLAP